MSSANRDEVDKCKQIAESALRAGDGEKAVRFLQKAKRMCPSDESIDALLERVAASGGGGGGGGGDGNEGEPAFEPRGQRPQAAPREESPPRMRRPAAAAPSASPGGGDSRKNKNGETYTTAQAKEVQQILRTKDYYDIVGVPRDANEEQVKRAFKKLALRLHPDKNKAPGAEEAFKKVGKAVQCLIDPEKKQVYDRYGDEERIPQRHRHQHAQPDFMTPEDLFEAFFGRHTGHAHHRGGGQGGGDHGGENRAPPPAGQQLMQLVPIVLVLLMTFTSSGTFRDTSSRFSFSRSGQHQHERVTASVGATYFVSDDFEDHYPEGSRALFEFENQVDIYYVRNFHSECGYQEKIMQKKIIIARSRGTKEDLKNARNHPRPACKELERLKKSHSKLYQKALYVGY